MPEIIVIDGVHYEVLSKHRWAGIASKVAGWEVGLQVTYHHHTRMYCVIREYKGETPDYVLK